MASLRLNNFQRALRADRWYNQHFTYIGKLLLFVIVLSGVLGFDTSRNLSYQVFALFVAVVLLAILFSRFNRNTFTCERRIPAVVTVGQSFSYHITVKNTCDKACSDVLLVDCVQDVFPDEYEMKNVKDSESRRENWFDRVVGYPRWRRLVRYKTGATEPRQIIDFLGPHQSTQLQLSITPLRRGYLRFTGARFGKPDPLGLFRRVFEVQHVHSVLVLPRRYPVARLNLSGQRNYQPGGVTLSSSVGESGEFHGLREYQHGDPLRRIHWRSWARQGKPMVKTYEDEFFVRHALILDTCTADLPLQHFEEAVSVAASLAVNMSDAESLLDLMFVEDKAYHFTSGRGVGDIQSMLEILACVQASEQSSWKSLQSQVMQHMAQLSSVVFVLLRWDETRQELVQQVKQQGVEVRVLLVSDSDTDAPDVDFMPLQSELIHLTPGRIEQGLQRVV